jgi:glycerophosphoryl diester phosphodiesterase
MGTLLVSASFRLMQAAQHAGVEIEFVLTPDGVLRLLHLAAAVPGTGGRAQNRKHGNCSKGWIVWSPMPTNV